jgi:hypothetical protein
MVELERLERELRRRQGIIAFAHPRQREAIRHPARKKCLRTPRQAGKTTTALIDAVDDAKHHPNCAYGYIALTRPSAEELAWMPLQAMDEQYGLGLHFQEAKLRATFANGAQILLYGADQKNWTKRLRGPSRFRRWYVDEAAFYSVDFRALIREVLDPTLMKNNGTLWIMSTPGPICAGFFYDVSWEKDPDRLIGGWENFTWSTLDNPGMREQYLSRIAELMAVDPDVENKPWFRREYLGEYVEDDRGLVYQMATLVPAVELDKFNDRYVMAVDFGYRQDATAMAVTSYNTKSPNFRVIEAWRKQQMLVPDIAEEIRIRQAIYPGLVVIGDRDSAQFMDELRKRFGVKIVDAEKTEKSAWIKLYNSDVAVGRVQIHEPRCADLIQEQKALIKEELSNGQWREHRACVNDACDAVLYAYKYCFHFRYKPAAEKPDPNSREAKEAALDRYWQDEAEKMRKRQQSRRGAHRAYYQ